MTRFYSRRAARYIAQLELQQQHKIDEPDAAAAAARITKNSRGKTKARARRLLAAARPRRRHKKRLRFAIRHAADEYYIYMLCTTTTSRRVGCRTNKGFNDRFDVFFCCRQIGAKRFFVQYLKLIEDK